MLHLTVLGFVYFFIKDHAIIIILHDSVPNNTKRPRIKIIIDDKKNNKTHTSFHTK